MFKPHYLDHYKRNISLAYPVMLSQLGHVSVGIADSVMVGQIGVEPLAAASFANAIFFLLLTFGLGVSFAMTPLVASADGEKDTSKISIFLKHGFLVNMALGILLLAILLILSGTLSYFNQPSEVVELASPYFTIISFSILPFMFFQTFRQFLEGLSNTKQAMYITVGSNLLNITLNYILIFGKLGFEPMGLNGAGVATLISRIAMALLLGGYVFGRKRFSEYLVGFNFKNYSTYIISRLLKIGVPAGLQFIFEVGAFAIAAIMIGWLGAVPLAAHQIAINLASISYMMATGIAAAATIRIGNQLGKKDIKNLRTVGFTSFIMVIVFMSSCGLLFIAGKDFLPTLYVESNQVIQIAATLIIIAAFFQISDGVQVVGLGALRGMADVKLPTLYSFIAYWLLGLPIGYFLGIQLNFGAEGIWYGLLIGLTVSAILVSSRFQIITKKLLLSSAA